MGHSKKKTVKSRGGSSLNDVTLNDFANASVQGSKGRLRKSRTTIPTLDERNWDSDIEDVNSDGETKSTDKKTRSRKKTISETDENGFKTYPIDIWHIISHYIKPEDVGRFAAICKGSNAVVNSPSFWFNLYRRYYQPVKEMPERLQPECMTRLYELKSCVIRALYYTYPPFASKFQPDINKQLSNVGVPNNSVQIYTPLLVKRKCLSVWSKEAGDVGWQCNFILKRENFAAIYASRNIPRKKDLFAMLDDISANKEEGCVLLQVKFKKFIVTPLVLGYTLTSITYDRNTLELTFCSGMTSDYNRMSVTFSNVEEVQAHNWWSPHYPHSNSLSTHIISCG